MELDITLFNTVVKNLQDQIKEINANVNLIKSTLNQSAYENNTMVVDSQNALCEASIDVDERITTIEDALCELSKEE